MKKSGVIKVITWNIGGGVSNLLWREQPKSRALLEAISKSIGKVLIEWQPDIIGLQEVHFHSDGFSQARIIAKQLGFKYYYEHIFHKSHLVAGMEMGLAVLSRYKMEETSYHLFPNPSIRIERNNEVPWVTHDKGCIFSTVETTHCRFNFVVVHMYPFWKLDQLMTENDKQKIFASLNSFLLNHLNDKMIVVGDFNQKKIDDYLGVFKDGFFSDVIFDKYTYVNRKSYFDHIAYGRGIEVLTSSVLQEIKLSDHFPCQGLVVLK